MKKKKMNKKCRLWDQLLWGKNAFGLQEVISGPKMPVLLVWTAKHLYDALLAIPRAFLRTSTLFEYPSFIFWRNQSVFSGGSCSWELGPKTIGNDLCWFFIKINMSQEMDNMDSQSNHDSGETEKYSRKALGKLQGASWGVYRCFLLTVPPSDTRVVSLKIQFLEPQK